MNIDSIKDRLYSYNSAKTQIEILKRRIEALENESDIKAIDYSRERTGKTNKVYDPTEDAAIHNIELTRRLEQQIILLELEVKEIDIAFNVLDDKEKDVLIKRYFERQPWLEIALDMDYSEGYCRKIEGKALNKLGSVLWELPPFNLSERKKYEMANE